MKEWRLMLGVLAMLFAAGWFVFMEGLNRARPIAVTSDLEGDFKRLRPDPAASFTHRDVDTVLRENFSRMERKRMSSIPGLAAMTLGTVRMISWGSKRGGPS
jgi:hypothetical protein